MMSAKMIAVAPIEQRNSLQAEFLMLRPVAAAQERPPTDANSGIRISAASCKRCTWSAELRGLAAFRGTKSVPTNK